MTVEVCKAEEYLDLLNVGRSRPFVNGNDVIEIHGNAFGRDDETKEWEWQGMELAFSKLAGQSVILEA